MIILNEEYVMAHTRSLDSSWMARYSQFDVRIVLSMGQNLYNNG